MSSKVELTYTEWDEHGHYLKAKGTGNDSDGNTIPVTLEATFEKIRMAPLRR